MASVFPNVAAWASVSFSGLCGFALRFHGAARFVFPPGTSLAELAGALGSSESPLFSWEIELSLFSEHPVGIVSGWDSAIFLAFLQNAPNFSLRLE